MERQRLSPSRVSGASRSLRACLRSPEKRAKIAPVMQVTIQVVKTWMITLRLFSYHSTYSHCVVLFHHFFCKHGGQSNDRRFFRMISLKTKTMSMRKFSLLIPNCYQRASWEKWVVDNLLWGFLALLWSLTGIFKQLKCYCIKRRFKENKTVVNQTLHFN